MPTECTPTLFEFEAVERRVVVAGFNGGDITSNAGALLASRRGSSTTSDIGRGTAGAGSAASSVPSSSSV